MLRGQVIVRREGNVVHVVDGGGARRVEAPWEIERLELSADGKQVIAFGDQIQRALVWDTASGRVLHQAEGDGRRHSLHGGLCAIDGVPHAFLAVRDGRLTITDLRDGKEAGWLSITGYTWFQVTRIVEVSAGWVAVQGHIKGESKDSMLVFPVAAALTDPLVLQTTLTGGEGGGIRDLADRVAVGPAGPGQVGIFRDPDRDPDDEPPDDPDDAFCGVVRWDLHRRVVIDRIPYIAPLADDAMLGGDERMLAIEARGRVDVVELATSDMQHHAGALLDPYRLEIGYVDGDGLLIETLHAAR